MKDVPLRPLKKPEMIASLKAALPHLSETQLHLIIDVADHARTEAMQKLHDITDMIDGIEVVQALTLSLQLMMAECDYQLKEVVRALRDTGFAVKYG